MVRLAEYWGSLGLGECQRLESFAVTLKVPTARQAASARFPLAAACVALFAGLPRTIKEIVVKAVGLNTLELQDAGSLRLGLLDDAIAEGEKYAGLRKVTLVIENVAHIPKAELESITSRAFPKLHASGRLVVAVSSTVTHTSRCVA